ncbi:MAG TPA: ATP-binding protein [Verrucomicrobiae bacterium]|nr:ATP-binding protein [Verrucomicrobiae bacterium]
MAAPKSSFLDRVLERIRRLDPEGLQTVVQRLARERTFLETLFNTIEDGVLVADETGRILYVNQAVTRLLGLDPATAEGESVQHVLPELDWPKLARFDKAGGKWVSRHEFDISYPRPRLIHLYAAPLDGEAIGSSGVALILHDATEARQRTQEAIDSERMQALTLLAASVAHEIGNPLNALDIHLQLMEREVKKLRTRAGAEPAAAAGAPTRRSKARAAGQAGATVELAEIAAKLEQYLAVSKGEIARLDYIIREFLQALRPTPPRLRSTHLNEVVLATLEVLRPEINNRGITLKEKLARSLPAVSMDPAQIRQALVNLIKNAIQAMSKGGVLKVQTDLGVEGVVVSVADTGGGIPEEQINRIFEPFYTTKKKGSGLGLMIVQRIVREHRGRIDLESHVGKGSVFRIWLPLHERPTRLIQEAHGEQSNSPS